MAPPKPSCLAVTRGPSATETMSLLWYFFLFLLRRHQELAAVELKPLSGRHAGAFSRKTTRNSTADCQWIIHCWEGQERGFKGLSRTHSGIRILLLSHLSKTAHLQTLNVRPASYLHTMERFLLVDAGPLPLVLDTHASPTSHHCMINVWSISWDKFSARQDQLHTI